MKQLTPLQNGIYALGGLLVLVGALLWPVGGKAAIYVYCTGSVLFAAMQFTQSYQGSNITLRRLRRQQILGALLLMVTGLLMIVNTARLGFLCHNEWMVCLAIAAFIECYTAFRIPYVMKHEDEENSLR